MISLMRLRHVLWWLVIVVCFLPFSALALASVLYELADRGMTRFRHWAYREGYVVPRRAPAPRLGEKWAKGRR